MMNEALFPLAYLLKDSRVEKNIRSFIHACVGAVPENDSADLKVQFLNAAYNVVESPLKASNDKLSIHFEADEAFEYFTSNYLADFRDELRGQMSVSNYTEAERAVICNTIQEALNRLQNVCPDLLQSLYYFLSKIYVFKSNNLYSSSKPTPCMGIILICPDDLDDIGFITESIVHEVMHQMIKLDHVLHHIYDDTSEAAQISTDVGLVGAISLKSRPFKIALESLLITATNRYVQILLNNEVRANALASNYTLALDKLNAFIAEARPQGKSPLLQNGDFWLQALNSINWKKIHETVFSEPEKIAVPA